MWQKIKTYFWGAAGFIFLILVYFFINDWSKRAMYEELIRYKKVEDEINNIKIKFAENNKDIEASKQQLIVFAEELRKNKESAKNMTPEQVVDYWSTFLEKRINTN